MRFKNSSDARCAEKSVSLFTSNKSHALGGGNAPVSGGVASAASRHRRPFSHPSTRSPKEYRTGSASCTSRNRRPVCATPPPPAAAPAASFLRFEMSFRLSARPVPSYPFTVEHRNTRYGPSSFCTVGSGMAAASSMTSNSACVARSACCGRMYWMVCLCARVTFTRTMAFPNAGLLLSTRS